MTSPELDAVRDKIINELELRYSGKIMSVRSMCGLVFYIIDNYADPNLQYRVLDKLLGGNDGHGSD